MSLDMEISSCSSVPCLIRFAKSHVGGFQCYDQCGEPPVVRSLIRLCLVWTSVLPPRKKQHRKHFASGIHGPVPQACTHVKSGQDSLSGIQRLPALLFFFFFGILFSLLLLLNLARAPAPVGCFLSDTNPRLPHFVLQGVSKKMDPKCLMLCGHIGSIFLK